MLPTKSTAYFESQSAVNPYLRFTMKGPIKVNTVKVMGPPDTQTVKAYVGDDATDYTASTDCDLVSNSDPFLEFECGGQSGQYIYVVASTASPETLKVVSLGILAECDCATTSFYPADPYGMQVLEPEVILLLMTDSDVELTTFFKAYEYVSHACGEVVLD